MNKGKTKEMLISIWLPFTLGVICIAFAIWILPKNCTLFVSNVPGPQMCHTIPMPEGCDSFCKDVRTESTASIIAGLGIGALFLPAIIFVLSDYRKNSIEQTKLIN